MWKKITLIAVILAAVAAIALGTITVAAEDSPPPTDPATPTTPCYHIKLWQVVRLLSVRGQVRLEEYLATQVTDGKLTTEQAAQVETFWTNHHARFQRRVTVGAVLRIQDESRLTDLLNQGVAEGKITQAQADKIQTVWEAIHTE